MTRRPGHLPPPSAPPPGRGVYCNRTLNFGAIRAIGYDMDYTLIQYRVEAWERSAYKHLKAKLLARGWPVGDLEFQPSLVIRGLIIDTKLGNVVKANRFGYVKRVFHGTRPLDFREQRRLYSRTIVELGQTRFLFMNTLFSLSEMCMYLQLVDLLDQGRLPDAIGYGDLYGIVRGDLDAAHLEGELKAEIVADQDRFVDLDHETARALVDQKDAGKRLLLITNSDWDYTKVMMDYAFNRFLPQGMGWRDLFELVIVAARKPAFFSGDGRIFEVVNDEGSLKPCIGPPRTPGTYYGGNASLIEQYLGLSGDEILFVGDHIYADLTVSKSIHRWRTALILRELEEEIALQRQFRERYAALGDLMDRKGEIEYSLNQVKLEILRSSSGKGRAGRGKLEEMNARARALGQEIVGLDEKIAPMAKDSAELMNPHWGLLMRTGSDKSQLARQLEARADVYTSRVSNFIFQTPFAFLRSPQGNLPHDLD